MNMIEKHFLDFFKIFRRGAVETILSEVPAWERSHGCSP
jgi:hypothetical protein